jgi:thymidylate kinase
MAALSDASSIALNPAVKRAFAALDAAGAVWCVLRGEECLAQPRNDIDLLLAPSDLPAAVGALAQVGFAPLPLRSSHRLFAAYEPAEDRWVKLDIVTEFAYGRPPTFRVPAAAACLELRTRSDDAPLLALEDRFWSALLHAVLDRREASAESRRRFAEMAERIDPGHGPFAEHLGELLGPDVPEQLAMLVKRDAWSDVFATAAKAVPRDGRSGRMRSARLRRLLSRAGRKGVSVALLGPDGAGKSTLAAGLGESVPLTTRCLYMGMQAGASVPGKTWTASASTSPRRRRPLPIRIIHQSRRLFRLARRSALAWALVHTGHLVIFDRFSYDAEVHWANVTRPGARLRLWLLRRAVLRPDVVVFLDVPGEVTFQRKGEHSPELLELRRERYLSLAARLERAHVVDATRPANDVRSTVTSLVWSAYARKHARPRGT